MADLNNQVRAARVKGHVQTSLLQLSASHTCEETAACTCTAEHRASHLKTTHCIELRFALQGIVSASCFGLHVSIYYLIITVYLTACLSGI